jgi:hypothetical protein
MTSSTKKEGQTARADPIRPDAEMHVEAGVGDGLHERGQVLAPLEVVLQCRHAKS